MAYDGSKTVDWDWAVQLDYWKKMNGFAYKQPTIDWSLQNHRYELIAVLCGLLAAVGLIQFTTNRIRIV